MISAREWALRILKAATGISEAPPEPIVKRVEAEVEAVIKEAYERGFVDCYAEVDE